MEIQVRRALAETAGRLSEIAIAAKASWGYPESALSNWAEALRIDPTYVKANEVHIALREDELIGFYAIERRGAGWVLEHLWVCPPWQGRGVGRLLFEHALQRADAIHPGVVAIEADPNAVEFYIRMGCRQVGYREAPLPGDQARRLPRFEAQTRRLNWALLPTRRKRFREGAE